MKTNKKQLEPHAKKHRQTHEPTSPQLNRNKPNANTINKKQTHKLKQNHTHT